MTADRTRSPFAAALARLLDETDLLTRAEWAEALGISEPAISQWLSDTTVPRAEVLRMIVDVVSESDPPPAAVLQEFERMAQQPAADVSPHGQRLGRSMADYLVRPVMEGFLRSFRPLPPGVQERVLRVAGACCQRPAARRTPASGRDELDSLGDFVAALVRLPARRQEEVLARALLACQARPVAGGSPAWPLPVVTAPVRKAGDSSTRARTPVAYEAVPATASPAGTAASGLTRYPGPQLEYILANGGRPYDVRAIRHHLLQMFDPAYPDRSTPGASCVVALSQFPSGEHVLPEGLLVDEMALLLVEGRAQWELRGGAAVELSAGDGRPALLWASADPYGPRGLPPARIVVDGERALGIVILYGSAGVRSTFGQDAEIVVSGRIWNAAEIDAYWASIDACVPQMHGRRPFVTEVYEPHSAPTGAPALRGRASHRYAHAAARRGGLLKDWYLPGWPTGRRAGYVAPHAGHARLRRLGPMLDFCLVEFPAGGGHVSRDDIRVAPHDDCYEVLVPLRGQARAVAAERATHLRSARAPKTFGELLGEGAVNADEQDVSAAALGGALPDVLVVNSAHYHGFAALKQADAWAFHVRCYDFKPGRRPGGIESDVQATGVARQGLHSGHRHSRGR